MASSSTTTAFTAQKKQRTRERTVRVNRDGSVTVTDTAGGVPTTTKTGAFCLSPDIRCDTVRRNGRLFFNVITQNGHKLLLGDYHVYRDGIIVARSKCNVFDVKGDCVYSTATGELLYDA